MANKKETEDKDQLSFFDILSYASDLSSEQLDKAIGKLREARCLARKREEEERKRKEKEEAERKAREEQERREAHVREVTCMDLPLDWNNIFDSDERTQGVHTDSIADALILSLNTLGRVDIEYISSVTGADYKTVILTLKGSIYQNPQTWNECFYKGWETADEYLSGNLMRKWKAAEQANKEYGGYFSDNLRAIERVLPPAVPAKDIYITLGSPWVPASVIDDFMLHLFGDPLRHGWCCSDKDGLMESWKTIHDDFTGTWEIPCKSRYNKSVGVRKTYGTERLEALYILEKTLNMKTVAVTDEISCPSAASGKKRVVNKSETLAAIEKQQKLIKAFQDWVWTDDARKKMLEKIFEEKFGCVRRRMFDGSFLEFPTMSPDVSLYPYQKNAAARIIFTPNTLLAHDVGAGKTYIMIAAGQEMKRMGLSAKNMYVVPNNIVGQWKSIFSVMYPDADVLCVEPRTFTPDKRNKVLKRIRDEKFDGIIIAYSCFEHIPLSKDYYVEQLKEQVKIVSDIVNKAAKAASKLKRKKKVLEKALADLAVSDDDTADVIYFDELGITRLFVDEAHNFKNVPFETNITKTLGINSTGSKRCKDMLDKVHMVQKKNDGKGVVLATGTPITNSVTDAYVIQQYLQSGELALLELQSFDSWIGMFAQSSTEFEIDVDTGSYRLATRYSKFHNLPELTALLSGVADFHQVGRSDGIPHHDGHIDALIAKTPAFSAYLNDISQRADNVRQGFVSRAEDNMLKITTDGRKAALDIRLVDPNAAGSYQSKVARCAENVADIYVKTTSDKSTQLVFCDTSTPKAGFNIYDELRTRLIGLGIPAEQVAFIHDADTEKQREQLFAKVRNGDVRILIGSTFKLGLGVNIQNKLIALHHLDVPWRPADMTQREGRILRQGNTNPEVRIFRYVTQGSFDAYSWQLLETKQRFITDLLSGSLSQRSGADVEDTVLDYAEVKALAVGDPLIKQRVEAANELTRYQTLQHELVESHLRMEKQLLELPGEIKHHKDLIRRCEEDIAQYESWEQHCPPVTDNRLKKQEAEKRRALREYIASAVDGNILQPAEKKLMLYRGFSIVLPANMIKEKPYVWLCGHGRYYVELGDTQIGNLIRIDNCLDSLGDHLEKLRNALARLMDEQTGIRAELAKNENYSEQIEHYKKLVQTLDRKLGVDKK